MLGPLGEAQLRAAPGRNRKPIEGPPPEDWHPGVLPPEVAAPAVLACATFLAHESGTEPRGVRWDRRTLSNREGTRIDAETLLWHLTFQVGETLRDLFAWPLVPPFSALLAALQADRESVADLHRQGAGVSAIARRTGLDRKTVRKVIASGLEPPTYGPRQLRGTKLQPFERYLRERLDAVPELTGRRLHRELAAMGYGGGYSILTDWLREIRPVAPQPFEVRFETPPGRQAQVDFAQFRTVFTDEPGVERVIWLFSLVLGHSRMIWARFVVHQDMQTLLRCHAAAFEALGGAPAEILYDRMRTVFSREDPEAGHIDLDLDELQTIVPPRGFGRD